MLMEPFTTTLAVGCALITVAIGVPAVLLGLRTGGARQVGDLLLIIPLAWVTVALLLLGVLELGALAVPGLRELRPSALGGGEFAGEAEGTLALVAGPLLIAAAAIMARVTWGGFSTALRRALTARPPRFRAARKGGFSTSSRRSASRRASRQPPLARPAQGVDLTFPARRRPRLPRERDPASFPRPRPVSQPNPRRPRPGLVSEPERRPRPGDQGPRPPRRPPA